MYIDVQNGFPKYAKKQRCFTTDQENQCFFYCFVHNETLHSYRDTCPCGFRYIVLRAWCPGSKLIYLLHSGLGKVWHHSHICPEEAGEEANRNTPRTVMTIIVPPGGYQCTTY